MVKRGDSWKMDISVLTVGPIQTNCYVVIRKETASAL